MAMLTGQFRRSLDDKFRVPVPKPLREELGETPLFVTQGFDGCLSLYPEGEFAKIADRLASQSPASQANRDYSRLFFSQAERLTIDGQGRIRLPASLVAWARLTGEIVLVGVRDHLELWQGEAWDAYVGRRDAQFDSLAELAFGALRPADDESAGAAAISDSNREAPPRPTAPR